jgi:hypothetical protein
MSNPSSSIAKLPARITGIRGQSAKSLKTPPRHEALVAATEKVGARETARDLGYRR